MDTAIVPKRPALTTQATANLTELVKDGGFEKPAVGGGFAEYDAGQRFGKWSVTASYFLPAKATNQ